LFRSENAEDIILLFDHFMEYFSRDMDVKKPDVDEKAKEILLNYKWPGNVRELRNIVQRLIINSNEIITAKDISNPAILRNHIVLKEETNFEDLYAGQVLPLKDMEKIFRTKYFKYVRSISSSDSSAAEKLGMAPSNFYRMCKELGIK
jgi:DNA-binding NtrC family response regulator